MAPYTTFKTMRRRPFAALFLAVLIGIFLIQETVAVKNIALFKTVTASSLHQDYSADPAITVDGMSSYGSGIEPMCLVTEQQELPWMRIDFGTYSSLLSASLWMVSGIDEVSGGPFEIHVGDDPYVWETIRLV